VPEANEPEKWKALLALAPRQYDVLYGHVWKRYHDQPPIEVAEAEMAPITPYSMRALIYLRNIEFNRSPKYPETVLRICAFDPDSYITLGNYYVMHAQPKQAAEAFQKAVDKAPDRIAVANGCSWYVNYLDDQGRKAEATALAQEAAEVYSYRGLETMARLMEKRGQLKDAENYFQKIAERYEDKSQVQAFYVRNASDPMFAAVGGPMRTQIYPHGIEKVALADLKAPPSDGLKLVTTNTFATSIGLAAGDVFVGFDGIRVHNLAQFGNVRLSSANPVVSYVVWNSHGYHEVKTILPARLLGVKIDNWQAK
jgi:tetratricopeptide (TPR) repeat protein